MHTEFDPVVPCRVKKTADPEQNHVESHTSEQMAQRECY